MVNQSFLKGKLIIVTLGLFAAGFSQSLYAAEYIQMKQGYQPVVSLDEMNRRVVLAVGESKMVPLEEGSVGRRTYLQPAEEESQAKPAKNAGAAS